MHGLGLPAAFRVPGCVVVISGVGGRWCPLGSSWAMQLLGESMGRIQGRTKDLASCRYTERMRNNGLWGVVMLEDKGGH